MNILVTGGLGVNGCWVTRELLEIGHNPIVFDIRPDFSLVSDISNDIEVVLGDVSDSAAVLRALKHHQIERICHLAAIYPDAADQNPVRGFQINASTTVQIMEAARIMEVDRVVFTSSIAALSPITPEYLGSGARPIAEDFPAYPSGGSVYGATKVASELMGLNYERLYGIKFVALRFATIYGPGKNAPRHGNINVVWNRIMEHALLGKPLRFDKGGDDSYDMTYSRDVAHSVVLGCLAQRPLHSVFHIGSGRSHTLREFVDSVKEIIPSAPLEVGPGQTEPTGLQGQLAANPGWLFDTSRAKTELGYEAQYLPREAVKDWLHWLERLNLEIVPSD
ncbi:MAG: UDP-glucose 4-epimerase [Chloroflexi bacterium]|jgi:UDP-glucose 4-epimerase|nr:MAG: UDP-glucose 4-epimerase [Chloroflexota bacterium]